jgi:hypothetical protein
MYTNVNLAAPIGALALLGTGGLLFISALVLLESLIVRKRMRARAVFLAMVMIGGLYLVIMLIFSIVSHDKLLARGEEKHFCELDCHLAYSVVNRQPAQANAQGTYQTIITIKTRFDETTIAPWRGNGLLYPNPRALALVDEQGNRYRPVAQSGTPLTTPLRPGESYTTDLAFYLPAERKAVTLLLNESAWETRFLIGHENSLLHGKTRFQI